MIVAFDNTILTLAFYPNAKPSLDPQTNRPVEHIKQRIETLIDHHSTAGDTVLLPTPALSETYTIVENPELLAETVSQFHCFRPAAFDNRSALELALISRAAIAQGDKRSGAIEPYQKVKFDRQIVAIATVNGAKILYTDDITQTKFAKNAGLEVVHSWELKMSPKRAQGDLLD